jgi:hypothetical protein
MCHETLGPGQERTNDQSNAHRDLNRKIQIRAITSMRAGKPSMAHTSSPALSRYVTTGTVQRL